MSGFFHFGALLAVAALFSTSSGAQISAPVQPQNNTQANAQASSPNDARVNDARVQAVSVRGNAGAMEVEILTSGAAVAPDTQAITGPDRIVVDFPGALPAAELHALEVNRGALKRVRAGLFFSNPPITRIVLDLDAPQTYKISTAQNVVVIKFGNGSQATAKPIQVQLDLSQSPTEKSGKVQSKSAVAPVARLQNAILPGGASTATGPTGGALPEHRAAVANVAASHDLGVGHFEAPHVETPHVESHAVEARAIQPAPVNSAALEPLAALTPLPADAVVPSQPHIKVSYVGGMLQIHAEKSTLAEVLFEVQRQTQAEIAIPAGAEQEQVIADIGPAPARDVLATLLNGSHYNFIFVGNELTLERVILTRRE
jgi:hypothetical protein